MKGLFVCYVLFFAILLWFFHHYKLYKDDKYRVYIKLFIASNVLFTIYIIYLQIQSNREETLNSNSVLYEKIMSKLFDDTLKIFRKNPKMKYFYDDLFNNNGSHSNSHSHMNSHVNMNMNAIQRDKMMEQNITYNIMSALANYSVFYYSHVDLDDYKDLVTHQRDRVLQIVTQFLKSDIFKENAAKCLNEFAGVNLVKFFKDFFNMVPSNPSI